MTDGQPIDRVLEEALLVGYERFAGTLPLDVREPDELDDGTIADALNVPLGSLDDRIGELPDRRPVLTYCAAGERSTTAASILERHGVGPIANLAGGYGAWRRAGRD